MLATTQTFRTKTKAFKTYKNEFNSNQSKLGGISANVHKKQSNCLVILSKFPKFMEIDQENYSKQVNTKNVMSNENSFASFKITFRVLWFTHWVCYFAASNFETNTSSDALL